MAGADRLTVLYCHGCKHAWVDDGIGFGDGACTCTCTDETDPHYEDWVVNPGFAIPDEAWENAP